MKLVRQFVRRPQRVWLRRLNFQVHLWVGLVLALYLIVIGFTGSILVFRSELERLSRQNFWMLQRRSGSLANIATVVENIETAYPGRRITTVFVPNQDSPVFLADLLGRHGRTTIAADPISGAVLQEVHPEKSWLNFVQDLHITLLIGPKGRMINGIGGAFLFLLNVTGLVIWWPGIRSWKRALIVDFRRTWRRINFDFHRAAGFWTLTIVSFWAISAIYFGWPAQVFAFVNRLSPVISAKPPMVTAQPVPGSAAEPDLRSLVSLASKFDPGATLSGIEFPYSRRAPLEIFMRRGNGVGREYTDTLYFNPADGKLLTIWRYGVNQSLGDWLIWLEVPLHYGTYWGLSIKILWSLLGLSIPLITISGALMYWNRVLRHKWKHLRDIASLAEPANNPGRI
jgi:uncharacterized iron-regulated membrane protein